MEADEGDVISVVIPVFNREEILKAAIDSALKQLPPGSELVIVDDGSTDHSRDVAREFTDCARAAKIEVIIIACEHTGNVSSLRNLGAREASGDILLFLDSDVVLQEGFLDRVSWFILNHPEAGCVSGITYTPDAARKIYSSGNRFPNRVARVLYLLRPARIEDAPYRVDVVSNVFAVQKHVFLQVGGFNEQIHYMGDETCLQLRLAAYGFPSYIVPSASATHHKEQVLSIVARAKVFQPRVHTNMVAEPILVQRSVLSPRLFYLFLMFNTLRISVVEGVYLLTSMVLLRPSTAISRATNAARTFLRVIASVDSHTFGVDNTR